MDTPESADVQTIRELLHAEEEASGAGDLDALMAIRTDDFVSIPPGSPAVQGKEAVRAFLSRMFDAFRPTKTEFGFEEIRVSGDLAFARGDYEMRLVPSSGGDPIRDRGNTLFVAERQGNGSWKLARAMWNSSEMPSERDGEDS